MTRLTHDKKILYVIAGALLLLLLICVFTQIGSEQLIVAGLLLAYTVFTMITLRRRGAKGKSSREVLLLMTVLGALFVVLMYISRAFFGYYENPYFVKNGNLLLKIVPIAVMIVTVELLRSVFLARKDRAASVLSYLSALCVDILMYASISDITSFNRFMDLVGLYLFPAITANALYHYVSKRYGALPCIIYRALTTLYIYVLPTVSAMPDAMHACIKTVLPLIILALVTAMYERKQRRVKRKKDKITYAVVAVCALLMIGVVMLISCQFRFGAIVIATDSMTGEINRGDVVIFEQYDGERIDVGEVIVFERDGRRIVHRVAYMELDGGEYHYFTKGDANPNIDQGYVTKNDIVGLVSLKVAYIGYPTLWLRDAMSN